jgi:membrane protein
VVRTAAALNQRYGDDAGEYLAASIAYYAFLSFFPLLLLGLSVVGFALAASPGLRGEIEVGLTRSVPGLEALVGRNLDALRDGRAAAGVIGVAGLLWTGTGVVGAGRNAVRRIFRQGQPAGGFRRRVWLVGVTAGLGLLGLVATGLATAAATVEAEGAVGVVLRVLVALVSFGLDIVLFLVAYRVLMRSPATWSDLLPGAVFAAIGWGILKLIGAWYASRTVASSQSVYGTFAATVGVLVVLYLAARLFVYGAELNAVLIEQKGGGPMGTPPGNGSPRRDADPRDLSTVQLVGRVAGDVGTLVRKEIELARQEITEGIAARVKGAAAFAGAGIMGLFVLWFLGAAGAAALALVMPVWAALLVVAGVFVLLAGAAALFGRARMRRPSLAPEEAKRTIKEDVQWAKAQLRR